MTDPADSTGAARRSPTTPPHCNFRRCGSPAHSAIVVPSRGANQMRRPCPRVVVAPVVTSSATPKGGDSHEFVHVVLAPRSRPGHNLPLFPLYRLLANVPQGVHAARHPRHFPPDLVV